ncbi:hypothetical protein JMJ35_006865 [Cladonia borealis]|uniref:Uncharacterized protein n=1 Tax=Cladonia borealis TaxID=184061 RepID=A0AA39UZW9_9LECA|nr:hypothetical protein JMJ35_006865 [Cladonia borealis]
MTGPTPFDSWMEGMTAEFFHKLGSVTQTAAGNKFVCRVGLEDIYYIEYGDHQSLLQALTDSPHAGLSALLCVSVKGLTYLILNDRSTIPSRSGFQQVSSPYDWNDEFNKRQESRTKPGIQSASGQNNEAEADTKDFASTANRTSQSAGGGEDKGVGNDGGLREGGQAP